MHRIKITPADTYFSLFIRYRDSRCMRCQKQLPVKDLECSHFFGRTMRSVRFDEENCDALCYGCHRYWEKEDREGYRTFKLKQLGQRCFDRLTVRAHLPNRTDETFYALYYYRFLLKQGYDIPKNASLDRIAAKLV